LNGKALCRAQFFRGFPRERGGSVVALIINDDDLKFTEIFLAEEAGDGAGNGFGFVASRNDSNDMRPFFQGVRFEVVFFQPPKVSAQEGKIQPNEKHKQGQQIGYEDG